MNIETIDVSQTHAKLKGLNLLSKLKNLYASNNTETELNSSNLVDLEYINASNSNLTSANLNYTALKTVNFQNAKFNQDAVNRVLNDAANAKSNGSPLETLDLSGANMAMPTNEDTNGSYLYLRDTANITVTINA